MALIPKVFVSYSHDSAEHKGWVMKLATRLRHSGIDAILDQWELGPGDDLASFMERHVSLADRVVMVCTDIYVRKANAGAGGVGFEKMIMTADLLANIDSNRVIPLIRQHGSHHVPTFVKSKLYIDFSAENSFEYAIDELLRACHGAAIFEKPQIGSSPYEHLEPPRPGPAVDNLREVMRCIVKRFEQGFQYSNRADIRNQIGMSRVTFDVVLHEAVEKGLIRIAPDQTIYLEHAGKLYAVQHALVEA